MRTRARHPLAALGIVLVSLAGCGRAGPPVPPEYRAPAAIGDLTGLALADGIELRWTNPTRRADGRRLHDLAAVRIFRAENPVVGEAKPALVSRGRVVGYTEIATIAVRAPGPATIAGNRVRFVDRRDVAFGRRYTYVAVAGDFQDRWGPPSNPFALAFVAAPEPPRDLTVEAGEGQARLTWRPPERLVDGSAPSGTLGYEVLRAPSPDADLQPLARSIGGTELVDRGLENDRTYSYAVRAIHTEAGTSAISAPSPRVSATPIAVTPPSAPAALAAVVSERSVRLAWRPSPESDVAGYIVYRATGSADFQRIGSTRAPATVFVDQNVAPGRHRYVVTAEDTSSRRNESARSNEVTVTLP
jgi:predicted small lipoprotein YifL